MGRVLRGAAKVALACAGALAVAGEGVALARKVAGPARTPAGDGDDLPIRTDVGWMPDAEAASAVGAARAPLRPLVRPVPYRAAKRAFDVAFSSAAIVALALPVAAICAAVSADSPGSPLYRQLRVGRLRPDGTMRMFWMYKVRTMEFGADARLEAIYASNEADGPMFKIREDPRVTRVGAFLRAHSLDELPQFANVLVGDMSLVGPRPPLPREVLNYDEREMGRMTVPQGLTGYWQLRGRSDTTWGDNVALDLAYVDEASPAVDLACVARTARQMVAGKGAY